ncbi:hypothetical protein H1R20_g728, partial [Candolleomyces eurysporus]
MAGRQLGKLRQWAGEVIASKDKPVVADEFRDLENDIELRKEGANRLYDACEAYHHALSKKVHSEAVGDADKFLPIDALGIVMISHGEQFADDSMFGNSLIKLGRAHSKVAMLQEAYALTFKDTFIASIERFRGEIKEYEALRKKLDSRRSVLESATTKYEKTRNSKKEKDKREAEDEMERAQQRYDETIEDMRAHMHALQEHEIQQEQELSAFLDIEMNFAHQTLEVLQEVRAEWTASGSGSRRSLTRRASEGRSKTSRTPSIPRAIPASMSAAIADSSDDEEISRPPSRNSRRHRKSDSAGSAGPSRPSSRLSRRRAHSSTKSEDNGRPKDKEKEKEEKPRRLSVAGWASSAVDSFSRGKKSKDVDSFATLDDGPDTEDAPRRSPDTPNASPLKRSNSFLSRRSSSKKNKSKESLGTSSPVVPGRILKPPSLQDKKVVKALYDFNGSADELTFKAGTEIKVLNEVVDGWWMGEVDGKKGLFPTSYVSAGGSPPNPALPPRPYRADEPKPELGIEVRVPNGSSQVNKDDGYLTSDLDEIEYGRQPLSHSRSPFYTGFNDGASDTHDDTDTEHQSLPALPAKPRRFSDDLDMYMDREKEKEKEKEKMNSSTPKMKSKMLSSFSSSSSSQHRDGDNANQPLLSRSQSEGPPSPVRDAPFIQRKAAPPPPPPRRPQVNQQPPVPAIPERRLGPTSRTNTLSKSGSGFGSGSLFGFAGVGGTGGGSQANNSSTDSMQSFNNNVVLTPSSSLSNSSHGHGGGPGVEYDVSPFESAAELSHFTTTTGNTASAGASTGCGKFNQNPFHPKGMCSNCGKFHS